MTNATIIGRPTCATTTLVFFLFTISLLCLNSYTRAAGGLSNGLRILGVFPYNMNSHNVICEELMKGLARKGHRVDVYSHYPPKKSLARYRHFDLGGDEATRLAAITNNVTFAEVSISFPPIILDAWVRQHGAALCNLLEHPHLQQLLKRPASSDPPYDLVIVEISCALCYLALGRHFNVPMVVVVNSAMFDWEFEAFGTPVNPAVDPTLYLPYSPPMSFLQRLHNFVMTKLLIHTFYRAVRGQNEQVARYFGPGYPDVVDLQRDAALVLLNHDPSVSGNRPFAPIVVPIHGLHVVDHSNSNETLPPVVQRWLDESKHGCVYVSFGSMTRIETLPTRVLDAFYKSFENIAPTRVLMKIARPEVLPPGLPSNVLTQPWFFQQQVLEHKNVVAFVTHGGLMGTTESIHAGVPMIGVPIFFDQGSNMNAYVAKGMAIKLDVGEISERALSRALSEIIANPSYRNAVKRARDKSRDRPMGPMDSAAFWIEYVHRHGKDALKSPSAMADLAWWQLELLDVYAFVTLFIFMLLFILVKMIRKTIAALLAKGVVVGSSSNMEEARKLKDS